MLHESEYYCPECDEGTDLSVSQMAKHAQAAQTRRDFLGSMGTGAAVLVGGNAVSRAMADDAPAKKRDAKPAEGLIRELHASLSDDQKKQLVLPWDHKRGKGKPTRLGTFNIAILGKKLGQNLTKAQQDLVKRIVKSILSDDEAWERVTRNGTWDASRSFENTGCVIFGDPSDDNKKFSWVFSGHHLTLRCDGNSEPGAAFGGPVYYGHSRNGYDERNVYFYQTKYVQDVYDALDAKQQEKAVTARNPGDRERGIQFPKPGTPRPGVAYAELAKNQKDLVETVMRVLLEPFRKEDANEVMQIIKTNGGMEKLHLAFYKDRGKRENKLPWNFWRLEGPGFIWNYRVLPHVHCYVNITSQV
jgi:hypothetical protein